MMQSLNSDNESKEAFQDFLLKAAKAKSMVDEANEITNMVYPQKELHFELITSAPVLASGFGRSSCPDLAVRLVQRVSREQAEQRSKMGKARRRLAHGAVSMLSEFTNEAENMSPELEEAMV